MVRVSYGIRVHLFSSSCRAGSFSQIIIFRYVFFSQIFEKKKLLFWCDVKSFVNSVSVSGKGFKGTLARATPTATVLRQNGPEVLAQDNK